MRVLHERCAGTDVGKDVIAVAVRKPGEDPDGRVTGKRVYKTFCGVLAETAKWLASAGRHPRDDGGHGHLIPGLVLRSFSARGNGQRFAAFLTFLPLCLPLPASFLVLLLAAFALCFAFLATPMAGSSSSPDMPRSGGCHLPRWMHLKRGASGSVPTGEGWEPGCQVTSPRRAISPDAWLPMRSQMRSGPSSTDTPCRSASPALSVTSRASRRSEAPAVGPAAAAWPPSRMYSGLRVRARLVTAGVGAPAMPPPRAADG
jgi:hypothetical protein